MNLSINKIYIFTIILLIIVIIFLIMVIKGSNSYHIYNGRELSKLSGLFINSNRHYFYFDNCTKSNIKITSSNDNIETLIYDQGKFVSPIPQMYGLITLKVYLDKKQIQSFTFMNNTNTNSNTFVFNFFLNEKNEIKCEIIVFMPNERVVGGGGGPN